MSDRITIDPTRMGGEPCIRGTRITVRTIMSNVQAGVTDGEILSDYPDLEREDIAAAREWTTRVGQEPNGKGQPAKPKETT